MAGIWECRPGFELEAGLRYWWMRDEGWVVGIFRVDFIILAFVGVLIEVDSSMKSFVCKMVGCLGKCLSGDVTCCDLTSKELVS
jgi:hypothetical protein